jgi:XTP/dITP diphosphohydrolase
VSGPVCISVTDVTSETAVFEVVIASANPDKVVEILAILHEVLPSVVILPRPATVGDVVEDADSLVGNARLKARAIAAATGLPAVADDTGLFVDALDGAPGIYAARYAGEDATYADNCCKLLAELERVDALTPSARSARFSTVALLAWPDGRELWAQGDTEGTIVAAMTGSTGFGYDPLFAPNDAGGLTFAELGVDAKNTLSHRARAFRALGAVMLEALEG